MRLGDAEGSEAPDRLALERGLAAWFGLRVQVLPSVATADLPNRGNEQRERGLGLQLLTGPLLGLLQRLRAPGLLFVLGYTMHDLCAGLACEHASEALHTRS